MTSALPEPSGGAERSPVPDGPWLSADDVGAFRQGSSTSRWALARYLVGRAIIESVGTSMLLVAVAVLGLAAVAEWALHSTFLAVLLALVAGVVLLVRAGVLAIVRRLTAADRLGPVEERLRALVSDTRSDVLRELRRLGLPSHMLTLPLLAVRLVGRRRKDTFTRLASFEVDRAVPPARLDELHLLLRDSLGRPGAPRR
jgi:hypothetical protein